MCECECECESRNLCVCVNVCLNEEERERERARDSVQAEFCMLKCTTQQVFFLWAETKPEAS